MHPLKFEQRSSQELFSPYNISYYFTTIHAVSLYVNDCRSNTFIICHEYLTISLVQSHDWYAALDNLWKLGRFVQNINLSFSLLFHRRILNIFNQFLTQIFLTFEISWKKVNWDLGCLFENPSCNVLHNGYMIDLIKYLWRSHMRSHMRIG